MNIGLLLDRLGTAILIGTFAWLLWSAFRGRKVPLNRLWPPFVIADSIGIVGQLMEHHWTDATLTGVVLVVVAAAVIWSDRSPTEAEDEDDEI